MKRLSYPIVLVSLLAACGGTSDSTSEAVPTPVSADAPDQGANTAGVPTSSVPTSSVPTSDTADAPDDSTPAVPGPSSSPAVTASSGSSPGSSDAAIVPAALQFSAPLVGGGEIEMGALAGRPVLLWFWAPW